jgi:exopolysaccharide biosynthesis polyprenyl glycosylphosphotransferase
MIRERVSLISKLYRLIDLGVIAGSFVTAYRLRSWGALVLPLPPLLPLSSYTPLLVAILLIWMAFLSVNNASLVYRGTTSLPLLWTMIKTNLEGVCLLSLVFFVLKVHTYNRSLIFAFLLVCTLVLTLEKIGLFHGVHYLRKQGKNMKHVLLIGPEPDVQALITKITYHPETGFVISGVLADLPEQRGRTIAGYQVLGRCDDLERVVQAEIIDEVMIVTPLADLPRVKPSLEVCERLGLPCRIVLAPAPDASQFTMVLDSLLDLPVISFSYRDRKFYSLGVKRLVDLLVSVVLLVVLSPVLLLIRYLIRRESPGPAIFKQVRSGLNGRRFVLYKFRTMVDGAEALRPQLQALNEVAEPLFKIHHDPRITRIGAYLRKTSLDELPQFYNVLKGEMSLVGPRPLPLIESSQITGRDRRRLSMKPGITGVWQCHGRSRSPYAHLIRMDLDYVDNWSLRLDLKLLLKTIPIVIRGIGAM